MSFGGNKKSKDELGSSKGWRLDFSTSLSQSVSPSSSSLQSQQEPRLSRASEDIPAEIHNNNTGNTPSTVPAERMSIPSSSPSLSAAAPPSAPAASSAEYDMWGSTDSYFSSFQGTQQSSPSSAMPPPPPVQTVPVNWGTPISRPVTGQSSQPFDTFVSSVQTQFNPPVHSIPGSCATSVTTFQSSYDGASHHVMPPPPPQPTAQQPPTPPVYLPTRPLLPFKTVEVPKSALHALYGKEPRRKSIAASDFVTWHDGGPPHALQWTSCFVCPLTGELFLTRPYGANREYNEENGMIWYKKKTSAEHGAAATAYDCLTYRDFLSINPTVPPFKLLLADGELAYGIDRARTSLPVGTPSQVQTKVEELRAAVVANQNRNSIPSPDAEAAWNTRPGDTAMPDYFQNL